MFFSRKKSSVPASLEWLHTDMHSHLIPGIDDGSPDMATSIQLIKGFQALGYKKIITTPHILWQIYPNTAEKILAGHAELKKALAVNGMDMEIHAAAEYFIDEYFVELLEKKTPLLKISGNMVLVEISMVTLPMDVQDIIFEMQLQDYQPVIAHPERYVYLSRNKDFFSRLRDAGCLFQLNILSLTGHYGSQVKELAEYLLKNEFYDLAGTDLHHTGHMDALQKLNPSIIRKLHDYGRFKNSEI
jgi:tyrosine-protein phosphatase YwqE